MINRYKVLLGDTIRLTGSFNTFDNVPVLPSTTAIKIYDSMWKLLETFSLSEIDIENGYDFVFEHVFNVLGDYYVEIFGIVQGTPSLERIVIEVKYI